ncbi:MAG: GTP 3',8-cyclase MoaA [Bacteroidia bacterium]|jgi:cyclic pyranopterin phosphate synthase|nr:GTP 3',8-cyclase MoaA [Bacteroidia bacterium]MBP7245040.1 GTP 3',8-cyclase MoaA [Bacteroidia bacterium]
MLVDSFNRKHDYLRISLTDKCNLRCLYCMPIDLPESFLATRSMMNVDEIIAIAKVFVDLGVTKIRLTGGEPLVRKEVREIISRLSKLPIQLALTTNAVLVDEFVDLFVETGLRSVNVSLDSLDAATFEILSQRKHFSKVMDNIQLLLDRGFHVKLNMVVLKDVNHLEIPAFIAMTKNANLHIRFIEFMPFKGNGWDQQQVFSSDEIISLVEENFHFRKLTDRPNDTARSFQVKNYQGTFAIISTMTEPFCDTCNRLRLTSDGKMKNCLFSKGEADILSALRNGDDLVPIIQQCVWRKNAARGGQMLGDLSQISGDTIDNRSMISIGG